LKVAIYWKRGSGWGHWMQNGEEDCPSDPPFLSYTTLAVKMAAVVIRSRPHPILDEEGKVELEGMLGGDEIS
jgi:hypothetical protein